MQVVHLFSLVFTQEEVKEALLSWFERKAYSIREERSRIQMLDIVKHAKGAKYVEADFSTDGSVDLMIDGVAIKEEL